MEAVAFAHDLETLRSHVGTERDKGAWGTSIVPLAEINFGRYAWHYRFPDDW